MHHGWDDEQYQGYFGELPKLGWCFFPGQADQTFGGAISFKTSFTEQEKTIFSRRKPLRVHPNVINGAVADFEDESEEDNTYQGLTVYLDKMHVTLVNKSSIKSNSNVISFNTKLY